MNQLLESAESWGIGCVPLAVSLLGTPALAPLSQQVHTRLQRRVPLEMTGTLLMRIITGSVVFVSKETQLRLEPYFQQGTLYMQN